MNDLPEDLIAASGLQKIGETDFLYERQGPSGVLRAYYRLLPDARWLLCSRLEDAGPVETLACAQSILGLVESQLDSVWGKMCILPGLDCELPHLDHVLTVPPIVEYMSFFKDQARWIRGLLFCLPCSEVEFARAETTQEYLARNKLGFPLSKWNREPVPAVSATYAITGSFKSRQRRPAVERYTDIRKYLAMVGEKGGVVVAENFERERCVFESEAPNTDLAITFRRQTHELPVKKALEFLDVLVRQGGDAAAETL